ncbi:phosphoribosyltransferase family protein [Actinomadura rudentiformis]|uniref:phosphoribosyltransferase family protein n=1 Tax=Actinomadura rudentiformis TaxID=359158 RepID=UPI001CEF5E85|nr:phosphoribosyltransferase family protein [Actinomadura rudentiformis]
MSRRLDVRLVDGERPAGVGLSDLVGLAVRRNPRRAHLLVSAVLGKHVPTDPRLVYGSGLLLGDLVRARLNVRQPDGLNERQPSGPDGSAGRDGGDESIDLGGLLAEALKGRPGAAAALRDRMRAPRTPVDAVVLGYAETATALGHAVADALGGAYYLHSTRRPVAGFATYGGFEEEHSHATSHLLLPADPAAAGAEVPMVLVDDELSTGRTVLNTIRALHAVRPRRHYVVAALVDLRDDEDRARMHDLADELDVRIDAVALASGRVELPDGILETGQTIVAELEAVRSEQQVARRAGRPVTRIDVAWPAGLPDGGRHGFTPGHRDLLEKRLPDMAARLVPALAGCGRVLVLGFEELMYAPLRLAEALADALPDVAVRYSTTTRSPVLAVDDPGYAIRTRLAFPAHDDPADGPGERYAYNVDAGSDAAARFDAIVLVIDDVADTAALADGLLAELSALAPVSVVVIPALRKGDL